MCGTYFIPKTLIDIFRDISRLNQREDAGALVLP